MSNTSEGVIIQAARWLAEYPLASQPGTDEIREKFGLSGSAANDAVRAGNEMRERQAFERARPRWLPGERN